MIDEEIEHKKNGEDAYIGLKLNSLTDKRIMEKLNDASKAGVQIEMIVRGICCLVPGIKGETDNIQITSIVGRFWSIQEFIFLVVVREQNIILVQQIL